MSGPVIIRLQNLPLEARSIDIRRFFEGLTIPDGGVHIIGGDKGDAFIAFQSDEDARLAMARDTMPLCNARIKLYLSSKTEMQNVIAAARNQHLTAAGLTPLQLQQPPPSLPLIKQPPPSVPTSTATASASVNLLSALSPNAHLNLLKTSTGNSLFPPAPSNTSATLPSSIEQILFKSGASSSSSSSNAAPVVSTSTGQSMDFLSSLSKLFNNNTTGAKLPSPAAPAPSTVDPIKTLVNMLPIIQNKSAPPAAPVLSTPAPSTNTESKMTINQIFDLLQNHLKPAGGQLAESSKPTQPAPQPVSQDEDSREAPDNSYRSKFSQPPPPQQQPPYKRKYEESNLNREPKQPILSQAPPSQATKAPYQQNNGPSTFNKPAVVSGNPPPRQVLDPIIKVKNFTQNASYKEIRTFLQGIQIEHDGIKLLTDSKGLRTGMAFVRLQGIIDLKKALCRNGQFYEDRQIEVTQSSEGEFQTTNVVDLTPTRAAINSIGQQFTKATTKVQPPAKPEQTQNRQQGETFDPASGFFLKIYGLPANFDEHNLKSMFNNVKFVRIATSTPTPIMTKVTNPDGSVESKRVFKAKKLCQVDTQLDLERALTRQDERVGKSKVQIFQISKLEYDREMANVQPQHQRQPQQQQQQQRQFYQHKNGHDETEQTWHKSEAQDGADYDDHDHNDMHDHDDNEDQEEHNRHEINQDHNDDRDYDDEPADGDNDERFQQKQQHSDANNGSQYSTSRHGHNHNNNQYGQDLYVFLSGVPFSAREADVRQFFTSNAQPSVLHQLLDPTSVKPTGEWCCQFGSVYERNQALEQDGHLLRNRVVKVRSLSHTDFHQIVSTLEELKHKQQSRFNNNSNQPSKPKPALLQTPNNPHDKPKLLSYQPNKRRDSPPYDPSSNGSNKRVRPNYQPRNDMEHITAAAAAAAAAAGVNMQHQQAPPMTLIDLPPLPPELQKYKNSIVLLSNVSYEATREDILELFRSYSPIEQTLKIRHDDRGQPTGDAIVACKSSDEANKACRTLNGVNFMGRNIRAVLISP